MVWMVRKDIQSDDNAHDYDDDGNADADDYDHDDDVVCASRCINFSSPIYV